MLTINTCRVSLLCLALLCAAVHAQTNAIDAAIEGYVRDASGGVIQNARVTVRNTSTNISSESHTNADGYFRFPLLQVGTYKLTAEADGFKTITKPDLSLVAGQKVRLDFDMQVGARAETVEVTAETSLELADTGSSAVAGIVSRKEVEDLPIVS
ncbi:MAG TPA: carboxypeptidase-like regulatory domain-containing protein, partial [Candidatus Solibacter sp.]|nr:carboxypeptidase-like regulatory domain-containing protein [Candidatus Solibacter sp.]